MKPLVQELRGLLLILERLATAARCIMNKIRKLLLSFFIGLSVNAFAVVDINTANIAELQQLRGIGAKKAADIIAYREKHGEFKSVDELINVKGIGKVTLENLCDELVVSSETKSNNDDVITEGEKEDKSKDSIKDEKVKEEI